MTNTRPRRAWAAAATVAAIALAGFASAANSQTLVGVNQVTFAWQPASGQPSSYLVSRSLNGGPLQAFTTVANPSVDIPVVSGSTIRISVRASATDSTGALVVGPASPLSDPVTVLPAPRFSALGQWLLHCASCPRIRLNALSQASVVLNGAEGLPTPWVVLGHAALGGEETIVWHNPVTGQLALWDWATLTPIPTGTVFTATALRGVGAVDLDRNGIEEFLVQQTDTQVVSAWSLTQTGLRRVAQLSGPLGAKLAAARDFDRNGRVDLLWHHPTAGTVDLARFSVDPVLGTGGGTVPTITAPLLTRLANGLASNAVVASTGDYDGDNSVDVLIRYSTGTLTIFYLNRGAPDGFVSLPWASDDVNRLVVGSPDMDASGDAEIALRHRLTGEISILDPSVPSSRIVVLSAGSKWKVVDFDS